MLAQRTVTDTTRHHVLCGRPRCLLWALRTGEPFLLIPSTVILAGSMESSGELRDLYQIRSRNEKTIPHPQWLSPSIAGVRSHTSPTAISEQCRGENPIPHPQWLSQDYRGEKLSLHTHWLSQCRGQKPVPHPRWLSQHCRGEKPISHTQWLSLSNAGVRSHASPTVTISEQCRGEKPCLSDGGYLRAMQG